MKTPAMRARTKGCLIIELLGFCSILLLIVVERFSHCQGGATYRMTVRILEMREKIDLLESK